MKYNDDELKSCTAHMLNTKFSQYTRTNFLSTKTLYYV